jgi:serine/threonine-protein kinase
VHRVLDKTLLREVALKLLRPELDANQRQVQRFIREAQITAQLDHPNIVPIHEISRDPESGYFISMKLVDGETLSDVVARMEHARLQPDNLAELLQVFIKVCEAIAFAHSRGVIHRDLKPSNIMVGKFGEVYVMDWGVARLVPERGDAPSRYAVVGQKLEEAFNEQPGNIIGTPRYMPPEQIQGRHDEVGERSDVFALGATLYHALTGRPPYTAESYYNTLLEALSGDVPPPDEVVGEGLIPPGLSRIAMRAMAFKAEDRYPSAIELKKDVERFLRGSWDQVTRTFPPGERIITEGEAGDVAYMILEGRCTVFTMAGDKKVVLREMGAGEVFAETALFTSTVRTASVEAKDEVKLKVVSRETLTHGLGLSSWMGTFVKALADRFREVDEELRRVKLKRTGSDEPDASG